MPTYYQQAVSSFEPVAICRLFPFSFGCVVKYLFRAPFKGDEVSDLSRWSQRSSCASALSALMS